MMRPDVGSVWVLQPREYRALCLRRIDHRVVFEPRRKATQFVVGIQVVVLGHAPHERHGDARARRSAGVRDRATLRNAGAAGDQQQIFVQWTDDANVAERPFDRYRVALCRAIRSSALLPRRPAAVDSATRVRERVRARWRSTSVSERRSDERHSDTDRRGTETTQAVPARSA